MSDDVLTADDMRASVARALGGQTPATLAAVSYRVDESQKRLFLKAHFAENPSEADLENIMDVEGEVIADFPFDYKVDTEFELVSLTRKLHPLAGGFCYEAGAPQPG